MKKTLIRLLLSFLLLGTLSLSGCTHITQQQIQAQLIGTWSCQGNNHLLSGMTFHRNLDHSRYQSKVISSGYKFDFTDHFAKGFYRVRKNVLITKLQYQAPLLALSINPDVEKQNAFPKEQITHTYVISRISTRSLDMEQKDVKYSRGKMHCTKATEISIGHHFKNFLVQLELKKAKAKELFAKLTKLKKTIQLRKTIANNINLVRDAKYYRSVLAKLLLITSETIPKKLRLTSIVGQDLNYQFSGITDSDKIVEKFVTELKLHPEVDSVQVSENRAFNIISKRDKKKLSQTLYEFRVSISFKPSGHQYANAGKLPIKLSHLTQHHQKDQELLQEFEAESTTLVRTKNIPSLLRKLQKSAIESHVKFGIFQPHDDQILTHRLIQMSVTISIKGRYEALASFLKKIGTYSKLIALSGVQIEPKSYDSLSGDLIMSGYLTFYGTNTSGKKLPIQRFAKLYPTSLKTRRRKRGQTQKLLAKLRDPFNSYSVQSKHIVRYKPGCRHLDLKLPLSKLQYVGRLKQNKGFTALLKAPNRGILKVKEGNCIARSVSVSKILRSKIVLRQDFKLPNGRWSPRTITLHATD